MNNQETLSILVKVGLISQGRADALASQINDIGKLEKEISKLNSVNTKYAEKAAAKQKELAAANKHLQVSNRALAASERERIAAAKVLNESTQKTVSDQKKLEAANKQLAASGRELELAQKQGLAISGFLSGQREKDVAAVKALEAEISRHQKVVDRDRAAVQKHEAAIAKATASKGRASKEVKNLQASLRRYNNILNKNTKELNDNKAKLDATNKKIGSSSALYKKTMKSIEEFGGKVKGTEKNVNELFKTMKENGTLASYQMNMAMDKSKKTLQAFGKSGNEVFTSMQRTIRRIITTLITLYSLRVFKDLIKTGAEFEATMVRVGATANATQEQFAALTVEVRKVAKETIFSASEVSKIALVLGQAGFQSREIIASLNPIIELVGATMGELGQTTELVVSILRSFNLEAEQTAHVSNVLTEATLSSRANIERLSIAFGYAGPAGAAFGQSLETTAAVVSRFIDLGLAASTSGTTLRRALIQLSQGTERQTKTLGILGLSLEDVNPSLNDFGKILERLSTTSINTSQAIDLFGARAGASVFALVKRIREGGETITDFAEQLGKAESLKRTETLFAKISDTIKAKTALTRSVLEDFGITLFNVFRPAIADLLGKVKDRLNEVNDSFNKVTGSTFSEALKNMVPLLLAVVDGISNIVRIFGYLLVVLSKVTGFLKIFGGALEVIVSLIGGFVIKTLVLDKVLRGSALLLKSLSIPTLMRYTTSMTAAGVATAGSTATIGGIAYKSVVASKSLLKFIPIIGQAIAVLVILAPLIGRVVSKFVLMKKASEGTSSVIETVSDRFSFGTEAMQKFSKQTEIVIETSDQLNDALNRGQIILYGYTDAVNKATDALKVHGLEYEDIYPEGVVEKFSKMPIVMYKMGDGVERVDEIVEAAKLPKKFEDIGTAIAYITKLVDKTSKSGGGEFTKSLDAASSNMLHSLSRVKDYTVEIKSAVNDVSESIGELNSKKVSVSFPKEALARDLLSVKPQDLKRMLDSIKPLQEKLKGTKIEVDTKNAEAELIAFTKKSEEVFAKYNKEQKTAIARTYVEYVKAAKLISDSRIQSNREFADSIKKDFKPVLAEISKDGAEVEAAVNGLRKILRDGGKDVQNYLSKNFGAIKTLFEVQSNAIDSLNVAEREFLSGLQKSGNLTEARLKTIREITQAHIKNKEALLKVIGLSLRQKANLDAIKAKHQLNLRLVEEEMFAHQISVRRLRDKGRMLRNERSYYRDIVNEVSSLAGGFSDIGSELTRIKGQKAIDSEVFKMREINDQIRLQEKLHRRVLAAKVFLAKAEGKTNAIIAKTTGLTLKKITGLEAELAKTKEIVTESDARAVVAKSMAEIDKNTIDVLNKKIELEKMIQTHRIASLNVAMKLEGIEKSMNESVDVKPYNDIFKAYRKRQGALELEISALRRINSEGGITKEQAEKNNDIIEANGRLLEKNESILESSILVQQRLTEETKKQQYYSALSVIGAGAYASALQKTAAPLKFIEETQMKMVKLAKQSSEERKKIEELEKSKAPGAKKEVDDLKKQHELTVEIYNANKKNLAVVKEYQNASTIGKINIQLRNAKNAFIEAQDPAEEFMKMLGDIKDIGSSFLKEQVTEHIQNKWFNMDSDETKEEANKILEIERDLFNKLADLDAEYRQKLLEAAMEHRKRMADINAQYDRERRDVERDIFNERVEHMMELARLESELRYQGLTEEQQRADLLSTIDSNLSAVRIGTIEQRQAKIAEIQEQVKQLNTLENVLGMSQSEVEQGSLARLALLKNETNAFYNEKQTAAVSALENERQRELDAEKQRYKDQLAALKRDNDIAKQRARDDAARAKTEVKVEQDRDLKIKQLRADLTISILSGTAKTVAAEILASRKKVAAKEGEALAGSLAWFMSTFTPIVGTVLYAASAAAISAAFAGIMGKIYAYEGGPIEQKRLSGGKIRGGRGGIDDIHTQLPPGSYIVNRQSTNTHLSELARLSADSRRMQGAMVPAAVTSGEFYVPPEVYSMHKNRIEEINRDKTGVRTQSIYYGGPVKGYQGGGSIQGGSGSTQTLVLNNNVEFSGVNVLSGSSEQAVSMIYEKGLKQKIQQGFDNKEFV